MNKIDNFKKVLAGYTGLIQVNDTVCVYRDGNLVNPYDDTIRLFCDRIQTLSIKRDRDCFGYRTVFKVGVGKTLDDARFDERNIAFINSSFWSENCLDFELEEKTVVENNHEFTVVPTDFFVNHLKDIENFIVDHENLAKLDDDGNIVSDLTNVYGNVNDIKQIIVYVNGVFQITFNTSKVCRMIQFVSRRDELPEAIFKSANGF